MMQDTGIQTPVGIKVKGKELAMVQEIAQNIERLLRDFPGTQTVIAERISQGYFVDAQLDLERMAERGVTVDEALPTVRFAVGGDNVVGIRQADKTVVPLAIQYSPEYIDTLEKVRNTPVVTEDGRSVALSEIADVGGARGAGDDPERQRRAGRLRLRLPSGHDRSRVRGAGARVSADQPDDAARILDRMDRALPVRGGCPLEAARGGPGHARHHVRVAADGVPIRRRQLADHVVGAFRAGRRRVPAAAAGIFDDHGRDHRVRLAVRRGDPDRHHHDRVHS